MWAATADVEEYSDALDFFKSRFPVTPELLDKLGQYAGKRAWTIAGVTQLDTVLQVHESITKAIAAGTSLEDWKKDVEDKLTAAWGKKDSWHTELIFRNATQQSYNAGRMSQLRAPDVIKLRPYWEFLGIDDARQTKQICKPLNDTILSADDPFWATHTPQLHHACRSRIEALRAKTAEERGITEAPPEVTASEGFGEPPDLSAPWRPAAKDYPPELFKIYEQKNVATEGVHFKSLISNVSAARQQELLEVFSEKGLLPFLERQPLDQLVLNRSASRGTNGAYWPNSNRLAVRMDPKAATYGDDFLAGKNWSIPAAAKTKEDELKRAMIHEFGHHVHLGKGVTPARDETVDKVVQNAFLDPAHQPISKYAAYNRAEYFAESFTAYHYHRDELEAHDPIGFAMVKRVLELRGITP